MTVVNAYEHEYPSQWVQFDGTNTQEVIDVLMGFWSSVVGVLETFETEDLRNGALVIQGMSSPADTFLVPVNYWVSGGTGEGRPLVRVMDNETWVNTHTVVT